MKKLVFILFLSIGLLKAQVKLEDFGRITLNPYLSENDNLFEKLKKMNKNEYISYYKNQDYYKKYKNISI